ncbi:hypothetical protein ACIBG8_54450 [Nonomuraea sp. NPDC050556]|uniref:hypothetical protein n=1 Tax=Nonomuraea sp. NPDC050556 TaxID=3364369 RepID=UPI00378B8361
MELIGEHAHDQPNAMANAAGEMFFPDSAADACLFARLHEARPVATPHRVRVTLEWNHLPAQLAEELRDNVVRLISAMYEPSAVAATYVEPNPPADEL